MGIEPAAHRLGQQRDVARDGEHPAARVLDCRDAKDNRYLELALAAGAGAVLVTTPVTRPEEVAHAREHAAVARTLREAVALVLARDSEPSSVSPVTRVLA